MSKAAELAMANLRQRNLALTEDDDRIYFVDAERVEVKPAEAREPDDVQPQHRVLVRHYRYGGDTTFQSLVDLQTEQVEAVEELQHVPTPLAPAEFEEARNLALDDPQVRRLLGENLQRVEVEALVSRAASEEDPQFGKRIVHLLFRRGDTYLANYEVQVNLHDREVSVGQVGDAEGEMPHG